MSLNSDVRINPFDLPKVIDEDEAEDSLRANLITLHGLVKLMLTNDVVALTPNQEADLDQALIDTYARAGITSDPLTHQSEPPTIVDLYDTLLHMGGSGPELAQRLRKYTDGTFAGIFSQRSNIDINSNMVVFNIQTLEDELRPVAMYIILNHIWNKTRTDRRKRLLIVDEAWQLMKYQDSANFIFSLAKRARKYYLGLTTITQDVEDFMSSQMGRAIVANASMQLLLKQSSSAVGVLSNVFKLTEEESKRLNNFPVGQGLFFAGQNHVHVQVVASPTEQTLITTDPQALLDAQRAADLIEQTEKNLAAQGSETGVRNGYLSEKEIKGN
jgi:type IV secretory pathway VirB4 component